ncbi:hypothetical protein Y886_25190 [Xanthomonas hyacinthi DSM 19077]|nr:hypothetical protein Y886_25190 [Xanthomonas hyacinthi DSM 19077]
MSVVLRAANLGDAAAGTAASCGQLAGAFYGIDGIPAAWRARRMQRGSSRWPIACIGPASRGEDGRGRRPPSAGALHIAGSTQ